MPKRTAPHHVTFWLCVISAALLIVSLISLLAYALATPGQHLRYLGAGLLAAFAALLTGCLLGFLFGIPRRVSSGEWRLTAQEAALINQAAPTSGTANDAAPAKTAAAGTTAAAGADVQPAGETLENGTPAAADGQQAKARAGEQQKEPNFEPSTNLTEVSDWLTKLLLGAGLVGLTRLGHPVGQLIQATAAGLGRSEGGTTDGQARLVAAATLITFSVLGLLCTYVVTTLWYGRRLNGLDG